MTLDSFLLDKYQAGPDSPPRRSSRRRIRRPSSRKLQELRRPRPPRPPQNPFPLTCQEIVSDPLLVAPPRARSAHRRPQMEEVIQEVQPKESHPQVVGTIGLLDRDHGPSDHGGSPRNIVVDLKRARSRHVVARPGKAPACTSACRGPVRGHRSAGLVDPLNPAVLDEMGFHGQTPDASGGRRPKDVQKAIEVLSAQVGSRDTMDVLKELGGTWNADGSAKPSGPDINDLERRPDRQIREPGADAGGSGPGERHPLRAVRGRIQIRYRVDGALYEMSPPPSIFASHDVALEGHGEPEHLGAPPAAGWSYISVNIGGKPDRPSYVHASDGVRSGPWCFASWTGRR